MKQIFKSCLKRIPLVRRYLFSSVDYKIIDREKASMMQSGWFGYLTARRQQKAYAKLLLDLRNGSVRIDFQIAAMAVQKADLDNPSILEVGCGGGYYSEVFSQLLDGQFRYVGLDYSTSMIETAKTHYPQLDFRVGDACDLNFLDSSFDIVFNGVSLMHILDFEKAIAESRRVSRCYSIFHSVPVFEKRETTYLRKYAYGSLVIEVVFNERHLLELFEKHGLEVIETWTGISYDVFPIAGDHSRSVTYFLKSS